MIKHETVFTKSPDEKTLHVVRNFDASLDAVWKAWTDSEILDKWWAPKPYRAVTKSMEFKPGGFWLYCMMGPKGDNSWCLESFKTIDAKELITNEVNFCDEEKHIIPDFPTMYWSKKFSGDENTSTVTVDIRFDSREDLGKIVGMGLQEGFKMGMDNLDEVLAGQAG